MTKENLQQGFRSFRKQSRPVLPGAQGIQALSTEIQEKVLYVVTKSKININKYIFILHLVLIKLKG